MYILLSIQLRATVAAAAAAQDNDANRRDVIAVGSRHRLSVSMGSRSITKSVGTTLLFIVSQ